MDSYTLEICGNMASVIVEFSEELKRMHSYSDYQDKLIKELEKECKELKAQLEKESDNA